MFPNEEVRYDIKVDVENAIQQLKKIADTSETGAEAVKRLSMFLAKMSKETKIPLEQLRRTLEGINKEISKKTGAGLFSDFSIGDKGIFNAVKGYNEAAVASNRFATTQSGVVTSVNKSSAAMEQADKKARGFGHGIDVIRTALGTLLAVGIFQFMNALQTVFTQFIHTLRETELALNNLIATEKRLSEEGIEITPKGLQEIIDKVQELIPILSKVDAEELVSRIATNLAPALKLTADQIEKIAVITGALYVKNKALGYSYDEVEKAVNDAFLTGKVSQGLNKFGVKINDQIVKEEALRLGLVKTSKEFDNLTGEMEANVKTQAMINILWGDAEENLKAMPEYMQTMDAQLERSRKAWSDIMSALASAGAGEFLATGLGVIADALEGWVSILETLKPVIVGVFSTWIAYIQTVGYVITHPLDSLAEVAEKFQQFKTEAIVRGMFELKDAADTATQAQDDYNDAIKDIDTTALEKAQDIFRDTANAVQDLADNLIDKLEDLNLEYQRKALDAETDYLRKVEDINRDYQRDLAKLKNKHREEDEKDEAKYQLALWELRMRYLMDLEDALHARDARQVIRLQKQYNLDKEVLRRKHELENKERESGQAAELEELERRRQERLEDARLEYEQKLFDLNIAKQREAEDLQKWYMREFEDLKQAQERKLQELLAGWAKEQELTEANAAEVYAILQKYFGPGGMTDALYKYMMDSLLQVTANAAAVAQQVATLGSIGSRNMAGLTPAPEGSLNNNQGLPEGVNPFADFAPTSQNSFGSISNAKPVSIGGRGSVAGRGGRDGSNGSIAIEVLLSPDLEGRIVEESLNGVADAVTKINRSKV